MTECLDKLDELKECIEEDKECKVDLDDECLKEWEEMKRIRRKNSQIQKQRWDKWRKSKGHISPSEEGLLKKLRNKGYRDNKGRYVYEIEKEVK